MTATSRQERLSRYDYATGVVLALLSFLFYMKTLAPTVTWGDPAKLAVFAYTLYLRVWAANHALHNLVGWLWGQLPFADYAYGQNLLSAVFASLTVGVIYFIALKLTASRFASVSASLALVVSHTFWWLAVIAESYSLLFFLLAVCILSALMWGQSREARWLYLFSFAFGLGITNHALMLLFAPGFAFYFLLEDHRFLLKGGRLIGIAVAFIAGLSLLIGVFIYSLRWYSAGELVQQMTTGSLVAYWRDASKIVRETVMYLLYLAYQFPGLGLLLGAGGTWVLWRRSKKAFALLVSLFASVVIFSAGYMYQRQFEVLVPSYLVFALAVGVGAGYLREKVRVVVNERAALVAAVALAGSIIVVPGLTYYAAPSVMRNTAMAQLGIRHMPYRDNARYFLLPDKSGYDGAASYGREVLEGLPPGAVILADFTPVVVLEYLQTVEGIRSDVLIVNVEAATSGRVALEAVQKYDGRRPIYMTDYRTYPQFFAVSELSKDYQLEPQGHIFQLVKKE